jgi:hypothetical protein
MPQLFDGISSFLLELRRRRVFRVAVVYGAVAFVVAQAADIAFPALHLPGAAFLAVSAGLALLVAPTLEHRIRFRHVDKERWLFRANRMVIGASVLVAVGIGLAVFLVVGTLVDVWLAGLIAGANAAWFAWFWFGLPLVRRARSDPG